MRIPVIWADGVVAQPSARLGGPSRSGLKHVGFSSYSATRSLWIQIWAYPGAASLGRPFEWTTGAAPAFSRLLWGVCKTLCGVLTPHPPFAFCSTVVLKEVKLPCNMGRTTNVKAYLEPIRWAHLSLPPVAVCGHLCCGPTVPVPIQRRTKQKFTMQPVQLYLKACTTLA